MKLIVKQGIFKAIPYVEYYMDGVTPKGLLFIQHGYTSDKIDGAEFLSMQFARKQYHVVAIDAYKHGDRIEEPLISAPDNLKILSLFEVVPQTAKDIITLFDEKYSQYKTFDYIGFSMGGMIGFLIITLTDKIRKVAPVIGAPYHYDYLRKLDWFEDRSALDAFMDEHIQELNKVDPKNNVDKMIYEEMFIQYGKQDTVVPGIYNQLFYDEYKNEKMRIKAYDAEHETTDEMQADLVRFIESEMVE